MVKTTSTRFLFPFLAFFMVFYTLKMEAQIVIGTPDLQFSQACANETFNTFTVNFVFNPASGVDPSNQFIVELSDAEGDFSDPSVVFTSAPGAITTSPASVDFSLPITTAGEGYKVKIRSTSPATSSTPSTAFSAYYKLQDSPFSINDLNPEASFCPGGSYLLTIDNPGGPGNDSPLNYPSLSYIWFKEINPTTFVPVGEGPTFSVTEEGVYFVETNYGSCTSDSFSNRVTLTEATSQDEVFATILSSSGNPFCGADGPTTLTTVEGDSYQWYKEGAAIAGATDQNYETAVSGSYSVVVRFGICEATGDIDLDTGDFTSSIDAGAVNPLEEGDTLTVTVETTAVNPQFQWLLDGEEILGATQSIYHATEFGFYTVIITQGGDCNTSQELFFEVQEYINPFPDVASIPNLISPNGDGINDTWIIPASYVSGSNTEVIIYSSKGDTVFSTKDYQNDWPQNQLSLSSVNQIFYYMIIPEGKEPKKGSITIVR